MTGTYDGNTEEIVGLCFGPCFNVLQNRPNLNLRRKNFKSKLFHSQKHRQR